MYVPAERAYPTPLSNATLLPLLLLSLARQKHTPDTSTRIKKEYDYVIVGGGAAGSVVASRLSELPCVNVLLIEAGDQPPKLNEVPALDKYFWFTDLDWQFRTSPQKNTGRSLIHRQVVWPSGKGLGGSTLLSSNLYVRGNRNNYDNWAAQGARGWGYKDVYPYFLKMEDNKDREFLANGYHTTGGPVTVHQPQYEPALKRAIRKAATGMGYRILDSNAARQTGFFDFQATLRKSQRCSSAKAYLVPAENRTNLDILTNAYVTKIVIANQKARGVQFDFEGKLYEVRAKKEVILSAGTVNTAKILMLSGVGPEKDLERLNIPVEADLPVGKNLQDHGGSPVPFVMNPHIPNFEEKITDPENIQLYIHNRTGPLASTEGINFVAFLKGQAIYSPVDFPNYQLYFSEMNAELARTHFGLKPEVYRKLYAPYENKPLFMCTVSNLQPRSRGTVTLKSKNPYEPPVINPNYLENPKDIDDIVQGMKTCQRIASSPPLRKLGVRPFKTLIPGCEKYAGDEDEYFSCQVRSIFISLQNPVGTTKMGHPKDPSTVVDPELRVKNVERLRVVDASIMPVITSGDTQVPTLMIAEKASEMIKESVDCYKKDLEEWDEDDDDGQPQWSEKENSEEEKEDWNKSTEAPWVDEYVEAPREKWEAPKESWLNKEKKSLNKYLEKPKKSPWSEDDSNKEYIKLTHKPSWSSEEDSYEEEYNKPKKGSWSSSGKYYLRDYIKNPEEIEDEKSYSKSYWEDSKPISWYKEQTDKILSELNEPLHAPYNDENRYSKPQWNNGERYKVTKSLDELVKLADMGPKKSNRWSHSYSGSLMPWH